ncbi:Rieske (2Fe-2S) protein [Streptomyces sp. NPDC059785]|uniref:Rieske (2Fe-2S) protein n=1 Tax=unclassified Streptomyces TaxID=2593676 RepID=UPI00364F1BD3
MAEVDARSARSDDAPLPGGPWPAELMSRLERSSALDTVTSPLQKAVRALPLGRAREVLRGRPVGHSLHPALVELPLGAWLSASVLDAFPGTRRGATVLVGVGTAAALPAALAGWVDWAELHEQQMRTGVVHAAANAAAVALCGASWLARVRGRGGRLLLLAGVTVAGAGGLLGGHLAHRQAAGTNQAEAVPHLLSPEPYDLGPVDELPVGQLVRRTADDVPLVVLRDTDGSVHVLADRCSHLSGPLHEGEVSDGCVVCPWHSTAFRLSDGAVMSGPGTAPQPRFSTRVENGRLLAWLPGAG